MRIPALLLLTILAASRACPQNKELMKPVHTNALADETSPYLLQHAHNPVNWVAWDPEILERAERERKLLLISIGYAACHWCHVMEKECFEDQAVAEVMNANFICIKVDREERPDIDHIYMDALQMMTGSGGWPLNIVALPDGRPFWGATYLRKQDWVSALRHLAQLYASQPARVESYARDLADGIREVNLLPDTSSHEALSAGELDDAIKNWSRLFDKDLGGYGHAPKFMMPVNLDALLHYSTLRQDKAIGSYVNTTLTRMAWGGIYDHIGGGFSRYSVDRKWHVPHFEKMLYDNAQLISLYAKAYGASGNPLYKKVVDETIAFASRELMSPEFGFYSSLDADSPNREDTPEEGAYYVWDKESLKKLLGERFGVFKAYYNINPFGHWENGNYVLIRRAGDEAIARKQGISEAVLQETIASCKQILAREREKRERPGLDDKILASWNGLMLKGLVDAHRYTGSDAYLELAIRNADFLVNNMIREGGQIYHSHKNGSSKISGYLEDYASVSDAFLALYEVSFDEKWLMTAKMLIDHCLREFYDNEGGLFYFTSKNAHYIIRRTVEVADNVIPSSNSVMAGNLFRMSKHFPGTDYEAVWNRMLQKVQPNLAKQAQNYANWLHLPLYLQHRFYEIAIVGPEHKEQRARLQARYHPNLLIAGSPSGSELPLLRDRFVKDKTLLYVCQEGSCRLPVGSAEEALSQAEATAKK